MSSISPDVVQETASDFAEYAKMNVEEKLKGIYETIEEMQLRLEEYTSIVGMLQAQGDKCITENVPRFLSLRPQLNDLCKRIDALDFFVSRVNVDLTTLEANMDIAESTLTSSEKKFTTLNPFSIFKKSSESTTNSSTQTVYQTPTIFKMEDYFKSNS